MAPGSELVRRGVQEDIASIPETLKSWDSCMAKSWCKYPVIAACVVGGLILISITWCCYRCCCRRRRRKAERSKSTFFNDPVPAYMTSGTTPTPNTNISSTGNYNSNSRNSFGGGNSASAPSGPQYAYFDTGAKNNDDLPVMPSWNNAKSEKVEDTSKVEVIELTEVDKDGRQQSPPKTNGVLTTGQTNPPPSAPVNRLPLAADPYAQPPPQAHRQNFPPPTNNMNNPFGPQRLNSPFAPSSRVPMAPPARIQSPYPETSNMPSNPTHTGGVAPTLDLDFDFNPHINAQNQGPYANADIYPPEPSYQPANTVHHQSPQFSGTTAPPQPQQFTGTTSSVPPAPAGYAEAYSSPPRQAQTHAHTVTINSGNTNVAHNGFMAQMDDDFGHSPVHLTQPSGNNTHTNAVFDPNDFDHGGYGGGYNNNQPSTHVADGFHNQYQRPAMPQNTNNGFAAQQPPQAWSAF
ncbi:hypothetical protein TWF696_004185 [Orbilia brochopaga]|uniref:Uncharacterized protein n=1 Tax=Orbilia brochopaga TaxID=3140254 RepID=A0AAV9V8C9_9PEZI